MRTPGSSDELEYRRRLAVRRAAAGYSTREVADFLGVGPSTVRRWPAASRAGGDDGPVVGPVAGRPSELTSTREKVALRRPDDSPTHPGLETGLRTAARPGRWIREGFGVGLNSRDLGTRRRGRGSAPQKPGRSPTGRASKDGPAAGLPHRPDRRERPADGPAGAADPGAARPGPRAGPEGRDSRGGLGRLGRVAAAPP